LTMSLLPNAAVNAEVAMPEWQRPMSGLVYTVVYGGAGNKIEPEGSHPWPAVSLPGFECTARNMDLASIEKPRHECRLGPLLIV
jgi:hypothetical protein